MNGSLGLLIYLAIIIWALIESTKRLMTLLWIVVTIAATLGVAWLLSLWMAYGTGILADAAIPICMALSAFAGVTHMRAHRRAAKKAA